MTSKGIVSKVDNSTLSFSERMKKSSAMRFGMRQIRKSTERAILEKKGTRKSCEGSWEKGRISSNSMSYG